MATFVDQVTLHLRAGHGGNGCVSVKREKFKPLAGPDGGNGGHGGDIILVADPQVTTLLGYHRAPHRASDSGGPGMGDHRSGYAGEALVLPVPVGTVVSSAEGEVLIDLDSPGLEFIVAPGGQGGLGNAALANTKRKAPGLALLGTDGWEGDVRLELKTVADIALVGYPSAGKSSLVAAMSAAKPKIADYPFTTLEPHLGVVRVGGHGPGGRGAGAAEYVVADVPGLIEGASEGRGLGHRFLRHVERARVLVVLVDLAPSEGRSPSEQVRILLDELSRYSPDLVARPRIVVGSRADRAPEPERPPLSSYSGELAISSVTGAGLAELTRRLAVLVGEARAAMPAPATAPVLHRPEPEGVVVERSGECWIVLGREAARAVAVSDLTNADALGHVQRRLKRLGVDRALVRAGAREGDAVRIGGLSFEFSPDR